MRTVTIHIFNPEHDHALAANLARFTPPRAARLLRSQLAFLPALWAEDGDIVVAEDVAAAENAYRELKLKVRPEVVFTTLGSVRKLLADYDKVEVKPWGWDITIRETLLRAGIPAEVMPREEALAEVRALSNRRTAVELLEHLRGSEYTTGISRVCDTYEEVRTFLKEYHDIVLKAPWSCSGRGVRNLNIATISENTQLWAEGVLRQQKSIIAEMRCAKVADFAVEFNAEADGSVKAVGLSLFATAGGAYTGNLLASEENKRASIAKYIPLTVLDDVTREIERYLSHCIGGVYTGPFGVDMMVVEGDGDAATPRYLLNPCVEINLRRTMGHMALALSRHGHRGMMDIKFENNAYKIILTNKNL